MAITPEFKPEDVQRGRLDCSGYYNSRHLSNLVKPIRPEDAMRLFWPPVQESLTQMVTPLPVDRQAWLKGWSIEYAAILQDLISEKEAYQEFDNASD